MIPQYRESSQEVELHSNTHSVCTHDMEDGWQCSCHDCQCETIIKIQATYDWIEDFKVIVKINPGQYRDSSVIAFTPERARALASLLMFAAIDAETLHKDFM